MFELINRMFWKENEYKFVNIVPKIGSTWNNPPEIRDLLEVQWNRDEDFTDVETILAGYMRSTENNGFDLLLGEAGSLSGNLDNKSTVEQSIKKEPEKIQVNCFACNSIQGSVHYVGQLLYRGKIIRMTEEYQFDAQCYSKHLYRENACYHDWFCCDELRVINQLMQPLMLQRETKQYIEEKYTLAYRFDESDARYRLTENELYLYLEIDLDTLRGRIQRARKYKING